jgi:hypothetical protein
MTSSAILHDFSKRLTQIQYTLRNGDRALSGKHMCRRDCARLYSGSFLEAVIAFELATEILFIDCLKGDCAHPRGYQTIVTCSSSADAFHIIKHGTSYVDWLPLDKAEKLSKIFFLPNRNPFTGWHAAHGSEVQKCLYIRNYIAHRSQHSEIQFQRHVVSPTVLPPRQRDVFGYFRHTHMAGVSKIQYHLGELLRSMQWLCT